MISLFFIVLLLAKALAEEDPDPVFRAVGGELETGYCFGVDYITLYKVSEPGKQLLGNSSNAALAPPEAYKDRVSATNQLHELLGMQVENLKLSDSGVYLRECWRDNELVNHHERYLYVCDEEVRSQEIFLGSDGGADLVCNISYSGQKDATIKWFKEIEYKSTLFLDTKTSQEPLQEELKDVLQVRDKGSSLHISEAGLMDEHSFFCLVMEGDHCKGFQHIHLPDNNEVKSRFYAIGEKAVLSCSPEHLKKQVYWKTPFGSVNLTTPNKNKGSADSDMYISKGEETESNSLVIPSITTDHSGEYKCLPFMIDYFVTVCSELQTNEIETHIGSNITLECASATNESPNIQWYRWTELEEDTLIYDSGDPSVSEFTNIHTSDTSLVITDLTEEDIGTYWCVVLLDSVVPDYSDSFTDDEQENEDETDDDLAWMAEEENTDNCVLKQVTQLKVQLKVQPKIKPDSESDTLLYVVIGVIGLVILLLIVVGVVVKLKVSRRATDQSREESAQHKETTASVY